MANRVYILPFRNDLDGIGVQITDLWPNTSQKNGVLDGEGQTSYVGSCPDTPGATVVSGNAYVSGSRSTSLAVNPVIGSTVGAGNDSYATAAATFGLAAYLRERVQADGAGGTFLTFAEANAAAVGVRGLVGLAMNLAAINAQLVAAVGAGTELTSAGGSDSFGTVEDILRIMSGEIYRSPRYTIITDAGVPPVFLNLAARQVLVNAQVPALTGMNYVASGGFLTATETGYRGRPVLARTGQFNASNAAGQIAVRKGFVTVRNPAFTYGAAGTAMSSDGVTHIGADGLALCLSTYDSAGNVL